MAFDFINTQYFVDLSFSHLFAVTGQPFLSYDSNKNSIVFATRLLLPQLANEVCYFHPKDSRCLQSKSVLGIGLYQSQQTITDCSEI